MATALVAEGKEGVTFNDAYDMWAPARQYMVYHGQPRILTEIASTNLADPYINPAGAGTPIGPQETRLNFPKPYSKGDWRLSQIVDYGLTATLAGLSHVAKYRTTFLSNFYTVHKDFVNGRSVGRRARSCRASSTLARRYAESLPLPAQTCNMDMSEMDMSVC